MVRVRPLILVADDDADILELVRLRLGRGGYDVVTAVDGGEALRLAHEQLPDLAVLDIAMPVLDGCEVVARLRRHAPTSGMPVILLTALAAPDDVEEGLAAGADDYVSKPFSPELLQARVGELLRRAGADACPPLRLAGAEASA